MFDQQTIWVTNVWAKNPKPNCKPDHGS